MSDKTTLASCAFCGAPNSDTAPLFEGATIFVCGDCVDRMYHLLHDGEPPVTESSHGPHPV